MSGATAIRRKCCCERHCPTCDGYEDGGDSDCYRFRTTGLTLPSCWSDGLGSWWTVDCLVDGVPGDINGRWLLLRRDASDPCYWWGRDTDMDGHTLAIRIRQYSDSGCTTLVNTWTSSGLGVQLWFGGGAGEVLFGDGDGNWPELGYYPLGTIDGCASDKNAANSYAAGDLTFTDPDGWTETIAYGGTMDLEAIPCP